MPFPINRRIVVGKLESTPGTAEFNLTSTFPADADFDNRMIECEVNMDVPMDEEVMAVKTGDFGELKAYATFRKGEITFSIPCDWGGAVATDPVWEKYIQACGFKVNDYTTTGIGFQPLAGYSCQSITLAVFDTECAVAPKVMGYLFKGCVGNAELVADGVGGKWLWKFSFQGCFVNNYDIDFATEIPELTGASTLVAEKLLSNTVTVNGITQLIQNFSLNAGAEINMVPDQSDSTGIKQFYISNRKPRLAMNTLMQEIGTEDVWGNVIGEVTGIISIASTNLTIHCPRAQNLTPSMSDVEGLVAFERNFALLRNSDGNAAITAAIPDEIAFEVLQGARA